MFTLAFVIAASVCSHAFSFVDTNLDLTKNDYIAGGATAGGAAAIRGAAAIIKTRQKAAAEKANLNQIKALADDAGVSEAQAEALGKASGATEAQVKSAFSIAAEGEDTAEKAVFEAKLNMVKFLEAQGVESRFIMAKRNVYLEAYKEAEATQAQDSDIDFKAEYTKELSIRRSAKKFREAKATAKIEDFDKLSKDFKLKSGKEEDDLKKVFDDWVDKMETPEFSNFQRSLKSGTLETNFENHLEEIGGGGAGGGAPSGGGAQGPADPAPTDENNDGDTNALVGDGENFVEDSL